MQCTKHDNMTVSAITQEMYRWVAAPAVAGISFSDQRSLAFNSCTMRSCC
jgi:hypothetical protein